jgi:hypothetical protein
MAFQIEPEFDGEWFFHLGDLTISAESIPALREEAVALLGPAVVFPGYYPLGRRLEIPAWPREPVGPRPRMLNRRSGMSWSTAVIGMGPKKQEEPAPVRAKAEVPGGAAMDLLLDAWAAGEGSMAIALMMGWGAGKGAAERVKKTVKRMRGRDKRAIVRGPGGRPGKHER